MVIPRLGRSHSFAFTMMRAGIFPEELSNAQSLCLNAGWFVPRNAPLWEF